MARGKRTITFEFGKQVTLDDLRQIVQQTEDSDSESPVTWMNMGGQLDGTAWRFVIEEL